MQLALDRRQFLGCVLLAGASCVFTATSAIVKSNKQPLIPLLQGRFLVTWVLTLVAMGAGRICGLRKMAWWGPPNLRRILFLRGGLYWILVVSWWLAIRHFPIGNLTAGAMAAPVVTALLARVLLKEPLSKYFAGCICLVVVGGSCLIVDSRHGPHADVLGTVAFTVAFAAMSSLPLLVRISRDAHWLEVEHVAAWSAAFVFTPLSVACNALGTHDFQVLTFKPYDFITVGCASFLALCMQTAGFQLVAASIGTMMWYVQVPFGFFLQWAMFDHAPSVLSICGSAIVGCAALLNLAGPPNDEHQHEQQTQVTCQLKGVDTEMLLPHEAGGDPFGVSS